MSIPCINPRHAVKLLLIAALMAGCSTPMPKPAPSAPPPVPAAKAPVAPTPASTASTAAAASEPVDALQKQFALAVTSMQEGKDELAASLFAVIAKQNPQLASPLTNLGILHYRNERLPEAEAVFKEALQRNDKDYVAATYLGMIYRGQGRFADARSTYEKALAAKPDYGYAHLNLAILYDLYLGNLPKALEHYQQFQQTAGASEPQLAGWLADLQQRMKSTGGATTP